MKIGKKTRLVAVHTEDYFHSAVYVYASLITHKQTTNKYCNMFWEVTPYNLINMIKIFHQTTLHHIIEHCKFIVIAVTI
jgi:hypothetical protein